jgi:hypothetical protein
MDFTKIIVVSGKSGAFKVIAQSRSGFIAESLIDGKKMPISASNRITSVEDIIVFTETDEVKLKEVLKKMKEITNGEQAIDHKSPDKAIVAFFESVLPDYDKEKVYVSDMKKMIFWYNLLQKNNMLEFEEDATEEPEKKAENENTEDQPESVKPAVKKPVKKTEKKDT